MTTLEIKLNLPDELVREATAAGLLVPNALERLVREELRTRRLARFDEARQALMRDPLAPMTSAEIQAEIDAYRAESRRAAGT